MLAPADVEAALVTLLPGAHTKVPNPRPAEFTRVSRAGGSSLNIVQTTPRMLVECFATDEVTAFERAQHAWALIWANRGGYIGSAYVADVELTEPVNYPDPVTKSPRYQFVAQLTTSLQEIA